MVVGHCVERYEKFCCFGFLHNFEFLSKPTELLRWMLKEHDNCVLNFASCDSSLTRVFNRSCSKNDTIIFWDGR
jgi:hypothetical protein